MKIAGKEIGRFRAAVLTLLGLDPQWFEGTR